jgi:hypothetical protein
VWGVCDSSKCHDADGDGDDDGDDAAINGCTTDNGARSCGHWVGCPSCPPPPPPCTPNWGEWSDCTEDCGGGVQSQSDGCGNTRSQPCNKQVCPGECGTLNGGVYNYLDTKWHEGTFCIPDASIEPEKYAVSDPNPVPFPTFVTTGDGCSSQKPCKGTVSWDCMTETGGTENDSCSASINPPTVNCDSMSSNDVETNVKPSSNLCKSDKGEAKVISPPGVVLAGGSGRWTWGCQHNVYSNIKTTIDECSAPSCIANNPINATSPIMLSEEEMKSQITLNCPGLGGDKLCCKVTNDKNKVTVTVCSGKSGEIKIKPGENDLEGTCWFEDDCIDGNCNPDCDSTTEVSVDVDVNPVFTACLQSQCTASGTCAKTPKLADSVNQCESSCNSDADCTSGRMIETKP